MSNDENTDLPPPQDSLPTGSNNANSREISINRVGVKVPPFWKTDPRIWFFQVESQFRVSNITCDQTKFDTIVASIDAEILSQVYDVLSNQPDREKYACLKKRLISLYADTQTQKTQKLLNELELGDLKPSHLLMKMRNLANNTVTDDFLKTLWLQRLPREMRAILSSSDDNLDKLKEMADKIWDISPSNLHSVNSIQPPQIDRIKGLENKINDLTRTISQLSQRTSKTIFSRNRSKSRDGGSNNRKRSVSPGDRICFYHHKFGDKARKCTMPCTKSSEFDTHKSNSFSEEAEN